MELAEILAETSDILKEYEAKKANAPGFGNIIDLMARSHLETEHSRVIGFFLNPTETHHHPEFGELFLNRLKALKSLAKKISNTAVAYIDREWKTTDYRSIDLIIKTNGNEVIIIENKVHADDRTKQLHDYVKAVKDNYKVDPILVYLTLSPKNPKDYSIEKAELETLISEKRFANITYTDFILPWIKDCIGQTKHSEEVLTSALIQYRDAIEGITHQRRIDKMSNTKIIETVTESPDTLKSFFVLQSINKVDIVKHIIETQCIDALKNIAKKHELGFSIGGDDDGKDCFMANWGFDFEKHGTNLVMCFPFDSNLSGLWYGFLNKNISAKFREVLIKHHFEFHNIFWYKSVKDYQNWMDNGVLIELCSGQNNKVLREVETKIEELLSLIKESETE
ncbi:PD-(D/E)XK nuclease family protein [Treponema endosymbiont of Eucomonympha sp.]|uniref:PDDEXK-like family protein n=1 Tax=Treponema endosymbiont of Eucomonympha sp. TaxID=1580831 RepID=UPI0007841F61|nr:PD-(D/E)XK nuclease family protein [Treponema endosymbiont of Eucomonympha sp.]